MYYIITYSACSDINNVPIYITLGIIIFLIMLFVTLILISSICIVKENEVVTLKNNVGEFKVLAKGKYFLNPFKFYQVKRIPLDVEEVNGKFGGNNFFIKYKVVDYYKYSTDKKSFTQYLTDIGKGKILPLELAVEQIKNTAISLGVDILELTYIG